MPTSAGPTYLIALLVFLGLVVLGLLLKRVLPAGTTIPMSKRMGIGLVSFGVIILALLVILLVALVLNR
jgi:hypothetical protein